MTSREVDALTECDVIVVGAGIGGLYAVHRFREAGLDVQGFERGEGVGGTWYWNRYPGARCDVPSVMYSYSFSEELEQEWSWSEYFPAQDEIERYLNHVADRFDLRRSIQLSTEVTDAAFDEDSGRWVVRTHRGQRCEAQFLVMATGCLSVPLLPDLDGLDSFGGRVLQTSAWPDDVDLRGSRIALVGTGSSGVQATPELAEVAEHLYVLQRTAAFTWPSFNGPMDPAVQADVKANYRRIRADQRADPGGTAEWGGVPILAMPQPDHPLLEATEEEVAAAVEEHGFGACRVWSDTSTNMEANKRAVELYRQAIRRTVHDPEVAEALCPRDYPLGCKRPVIDVGYFETFNRPNVTLVDLREVELERVTPTGIQTSRGELAVDVIVFATGFDAMTGALTRIDLRGREGRLLRDEWSSGPRTYLGLQVAGFPNLFTVTGPGSPSVLANMVLGCEQHVDWIADCIGYLRANDIEVIEPTEEAQDRWVEHVGAIAKGTMLTADSCNSWYLGANVPGKERVILPYAGGFPYYVAECDRVVEEGYAGFVLTRRSVEED